MQTDNQNLSNIRFPRGNMSFHYPNQEKKPVLKKPGKLQSVINKILKPKDGK